LAGVTKKKKYWPVIIVLSFLWMAGNYYSINTKAMLTATRDTS